MTGFITVCSLDQDSIKVFENEVILWSHISMGLSRGSINTLQNEIVDWLEMVKEAKKEKENG